MGRKKADDKQIPFSFTVKESKLKKAIKRYTRKGLSEKLRNSIDNYNKKIV